MTKVVEDAQSFEERGHQGWQDAGVVGEETCQERPERQGCALYQEARPELLWLQEPHRRGTSSTSTRELQRKARAVLAQPWHRENVAMPIPACAACHDLSAPNKATNSSNLSPDPHFDQSSGRSRSSGPCPQDGGKVSGDGISSPLLRTSHWRPRLGKGQ